jgi:hypothetical protein
MNGIVKGHFGKHMARETKLRIRNIISKAALCYGSENCVMNKGDAQKPKLHKLDS